MPIYKRIEKYPLIYFVFMWIFFIIFVLKFR